MARTISVFKFVPIHRQDFRKKNSNIQGHKSMIIGQFSFILSSTEYSWMTSSYYVYNSDLIDYFAKNSTIQWSWNRKVRGQLNEYNAYATPSSFSHTPFDPSYRTDDG
jgi:hypothetical protein